MAAHSLLGNVFLLGKIETLTGLHVGAGSGKREIGGVDQAVLRDPSSNYPYLPGSSLKGKMRALTEFALGKVTDGKVHQCDDPHCPVCRVFGTAAEGGAAIGPARLAVRDAFPDQQTIAFWEDLDTELLYTEYKGENFLDRLTSRANPRFFERVVPQSRFNLELVYSIFAPDWEEDLNGLDTVFQALRLVEHSALGGHGSRGYGKVRFYLKLEDGSLPVFTVRDYREGKTALPDLNEVGTDALVPLQDVDVEKLKENVRQRLQA